MLQNEMLSKIKEYREYKRLAEEMQALADSLANEMKKAMITDNIEKMIVGEYKLSYIDQKRETIDKKRLEKDLGDLSEYTKVTYHKVFRIV